MAFAAVPQPGVPNWRSHRNAESAGAPTTRPGPQAPVRKTIAQATATEHTAPPGLMPTAPRPRADCLHAAGEQIIVLTPVNAPPPEMPPPGAASPSPLSTVQDTPPPPDAQS